jgi:proteasome lid subunit RPN8/RPN11
MEVRLATQAARLMRDGAARAHPLEACGLLFGHWTHGAIWITEASLAANVAADPAAGFEVDPLHLLCTQKAAREGGPQVAGVWHSHPGGSSEPSERDRAGVTDRRWIWMILAGGRMAAWLPDAREARGFRLLPILDVAGGAR